MKKRLWKQMILAGMAGLMTLSILGCSSSPKTADAEPETEQGISEEPEADTDPDGSRDEGPVSSSGTEEDETGSGTNSRKEGNEDLTGDIRELGDGQFIVVASETEETEEGSVMVAPASDGDDSDFDKVAVIYEENTDIYIRTIYDNGARYEDADGSAEDLQKDDMVLVWGVYEADGSTIQADQIQINRFVR